MNRKVITTIPIEIFMTPMTPHAAWQETFIMRKTAASNRKVHDMKPNRNLLCHFPLPGNQAQPPIPLHGLCVNVKNPLLPDADCWGIKPVIRSICFYRLLIIWRHLSVSCTHSIFLLIMQKTEFCSTIYVV